MILMYEKTIVPHSTSQAGTPIIVEMTNKTEFICAKPITEIQNTDIAIVTMNARLLVTSVLYLRGRNRAM
jgi:hypothetical protein